MAIDPYWQIQDLSPADRLVFGGVTALADSLSAFARREARTAAVLFSPTEEPAVYDPYRLLQSLGAADPWLAAPLPDGDSWRRHDLTERVLAVKRGWGETRLVLAADSPIELLNSQVWFRRLFVAAEDVALGLARLERHPDGRLAIDLTAMTLASGNRSAAEQQATQSLTAAMRQQQVEDDVAAGREPPSDRPAPPLPGGVVERAMRLAEQLSLGREEGRRMVGRLLFRLSERSPAPEVSLGYVEEEDSKLVGKLLLAAPPGHDLVADPGGLDYGFRAQELALWSDLVVECREDSDVLVRRHEGSCFGACAGALFATARRTEVGSLTLALQDHVDEQGWDRVVLKFARRVVEGSRHGCSLVLQGPHEEGAERLGQEIDPWLRVYKEDVVRLAVAMGDVDGALAVSGDGLLRAFGCLLDGVNCGAEVRARGSRFNSAVRYTHAHPSAGRPTARCPWSLAAPSATRPGSSAARGSSARAATTALGC